MTTLFEHEAEKERQRVGVKMRELADKALPAMEAERRRMDLMRQEAAAFSAETSQRAILADYASLNEEPVYSAGILMSPQLLAYGRRAVVELEESARRQAIREAQERAKNGERADG